MPYTIVRQDDQYCVAKESDGSILGCHDTREEAADQIAAIESSEGQEKLLDVILDFLCEDENEKSLYRDMIALKTFVNQVEEKD